MRSDFFLTITINISSVLSYFFSFTVDIQVFLEPSLFPNAIPAVAVVLLLLLLFKEKSEPI